MAAPSSAAHPGSAVRRAGPGHPSDFQVQVLGDFQVTQRGALVALPESTWRLVALLAICGRPLRRARAASRLWTDKDEDRAHANLRSTLWRLRQVTPRLIDCSTGDLRFCDGVRVDLADLMELARRLEADDPFDVAGVDPGLCCGDLLPDWYDDFVDEQRELVRQLRLRALEGLARRLAHLGCFGLALKVALTAVAQAPLRESAHQAVLEIHLAEGNVSEALRHFQALKNTLWQELGIRPSDRVRAVVAPWVRAGERLGPAETDLRRTIAG